MFTGSVSVLLTSTSLKIKKNNDRLRKKFKVITRDVWFRLHWIWTEWKTPRRHHVQHVILWVTLMTCAWKKPVTATTPTTDTTAKNKDTLYYYSFDVTWNPKIISNCAQTGKESKPPIPKAQRGKRSKDPVERVSYKELERAIIYSIIIWRRVFYWELNHS